MGGKDAEVDILSRYRQDKASGKVVVVAQTGCAFCTKVKKILREYLPPERLTIIDIDQVYGGGLLRIVAQKDASGHGTLPMIFFGKEFFGGCDAVVALANSGRLCARLKVGPPAAELGDRKAPRAAFPMLFHPHTVNEYAIRAVGVQASAICIVAMLDAVQWEENIAKWLMLFLACDYVVRVYAGGVASPLGAAAAVFTAPLPERLVAGAQKQFAASIGVGLAGVSAGLLSTGHEIPGAVVAGVLAGAAALEGLLGFCLGCFFFRCMIEGGRAPAWVNDHGYKPFLAPQMGQKPLGPLIPYSHQQPGQPRTAADIRVKERKLDQHKSLGFHPVKQVQISDFMMPLGIASLAFAWKLGHSTPKLSGDDVMTDDTVWRVLYWVAVGLFVALLSLLVCKLALFPHKFLAELLHPMRANFVAAFPTALVLFAVLTFTYPDGDEDYVEHVERFAVVMWWTGAVMLKGLALWRVASLVACRGDGEISTPQVMFPLVGCLAAALGAPVFLQWWDCFTEVGWFCFGMAAVLGLLLTGGTLIEAVHYHWSDERLRPSLGMWVAAIHLIFLSYTVLRKGPGSVLGPYAGPDAGLLGPHMKALYYAGVSFFLVLFVLAVPMGFLTKLKFDFSFWALAFPINILACATMVWHRAIFSDPSLSNEASHFLAYATLTAACYVNAVLLLNTTLWLVKRRWLTPAYKWAPLSLNKLTHLAFRAAGKRMATMAQPLKDGKESMLPFAKALAKEWLEYAAALEWHAHQEDHIMFREIDAFNPFTTKNAYEQHEVLHHMEEGLNKAALAVESAESWASQVGEAVSVLAGGMQEYVDFMGKHMDWEEENLLALNRKTFNMAIMIRIVRKIWDAYEAMSIEEFRAKVSGLEQPTIHGDTEWGQISLGTFATKGKYTWGPSTSAAAKEKLFEFPSQVPEGELPLEKQQVWRFVLPWVLRNLPEPAMRTRFVRCWLWAMPERAQHIGEMIYRGVDDDKWNDLAQDVPEVIPRGLPGWIRRI